MNRKRFGARALAVAAACTLALSACGGSGGASSTSKSPAPTAAPSPTDKVMDGGEITAAVAYETNNYHPSSTSSALAQGANWHVVEGLYELDMHSYKPYKALAATDDPVKVNDTQYEVKLRDGAKFSDGTPVTAADVVASFQRSMKEGNIYLPMLSFIKDVQKKDDTTVTINLNHPFSLIKARLSLVKIVPAAATDEALTAKPIGTGPWTYEAIDSTHIAFAPNPNYNGSKPAKAKHMEWKILKDDTARVTAMQQKTVSVMESVPAESAELLKSAGATTTEVQGFNLPFLMFNTKKAPFDNPKVRQALFYAINTEKLIDLGTSGTATPASSFLPETHPNYHKASTVYKYDPEKAKKLLKEAGVEKLHLNLLTTDHTWITKLSPQVVEDLKAVGVTVELKSLASSSLYKDHTDVDNPNFDVVLAPGDPSVFGNDPDLLMNWWYGDNSWTQKRTQWKDSEGYKKLHEKLDKAVRSTGSEQQKAWNEAYDIVAKEVPLYPLFHRKVVTAHYPKRVSAYAPISTTGLDFVGAGAGSESGAK